VAEAAWLNQTNLEIELIAVVAVVFEKGHTFSK